MPPVRFPTRRHGPVLRLATKVIDAVVRHHNLIIPALLPIGMAAAAIRSFA